MDFVPKKRIKLEFVIPESVAVGLSDLEEFLRKRTNNIKVEENSYLSEVSSEGSGKLLKVRHPHVKALWCQWSQASTKTTTIWRPQICCQ